MGRQGLHELASRALAHAMQTCRVCKERKKGTSTPNDVYRVVQRTSIP
jgi:hypothetical protein